MLQIKRESYVVFTIVREPVSRAISCFNSFYKGRTAPWVPECIKQGKPIRDFIEWLPGTEWQNSFAKSMCQTRYKKEEVKDFSEDELLDKARRVAKEYLLITSMEHFEASVFAIAALLGINRVSYWEPAYQSEKKYGAVFFNEVSEEEKRAIREIYSVDMILYEELNRAFEKRFTSLIELCKNRKINLKSKRCEKKRE